MQATDRRRNLAIAALVVLALIWGYNWVVMKMAVADAAPFTFAAIRALGGAAALFAVALAMRKPLRPRRPLTYFAIGLFQTAGFLGMVTWAVVSAGAGTTAMLAYTMPIWVSLLAVPFLGEKLHAGQLLAVVVASAGVFCMFGFRPIGLAEVLAMGAGLSWAIGIIFAKREQRDVRHDIFSLTMWQMLFGGVVLLAIALVVPGRPTAWNPSYVLAIGYNVILATAVAYVLFIFVLDALPARDASMGTLANPIVGVFAAWAQLGEAPTLLEGVGMVLIVLALIALSVLDLRVPQAQRVSDNRD